MKYCDICDRRLRTGRKYCFEHRNTRNPRNDDPIPSYILAYYHYKVADLPIRKWWVLLLYVISMFSVMSLFSSEDAKLLVVLSSLLIAYIVMKVMKFVARYRVETKHPEYEAFLEKCFREEKKIRS